MNLINAQCDTIKFGYTHEKKMLKEIHAEFLP